MINNCNYFSPLVVCIAIMALFSACSFDNASRISSSTIRNIITNKMKDDCDADVFNKIKTGYYEENDEDVRYTLRKLAATGVITYKVDRIEKTARIRDGFTFDRQIYKVVEAYKTVKKKVFFVDVALTEDGRKYAVDKLPERTPKEDKYLKPVEFVHYPEFDASEKDVFPEDPVDAVVAEPKTDDKPENNTSKEEPKTDYDKAKAKEHIDWLFVKCYSTKVVDVRDIIVKDGKANATFVLEAFDVSPFGRVYNHVYEKTHTLGDASFVYFQDKKWVVEDYEVSKLFI